MQTMSWSIARLGSRFSLLLEPHQRQIRYSGVGRFLDSAADLAVGLVLPDGTRRAMPFTKLVDPFYNVEQFERTNSITYRAHSPEYRLRFEFNLHSVFYPQDEKLCLMPAFYLEVRVNPVEQVRWIKPQGDTPREVELFLRLDRPGARQSGQSGCVGRGPCLALEYENTLTPRLTTSNLEAPLPDDGRTALVRECIVSLNDNAMVSEDGKELRVRLPVTPIGSGIKWRLVWGSYTADPVLWVKQDDRTIPAKLRYTRYWSSLEEVMTDAVATRDQRLVQSRNLEKALEQAPLRAAERHLLNQSFQQFLSNTFWCDLPAEEPMAAPGSWFSTWGGSGFAHAMLDVEYNVALVYLCLWPQLLGQQFAQWARAATVHEPSRGRCMPRDLGRGHLVGRASAGPDMPVEHNSNFLLLLQAYTHWTGDLGPVRQHADLVAQLADYLVWTDRDESGFASEGVLNGLHDAGPAQQFGRKQTYLAIKRLAALNAATNLLRQAQRGEHAQRYENLVHRFVSEVDHAAWLGDHYAVCVDASAANLRDVWTDQPLPYEQLPGWDAYSIYTGNGLLLPLLTGHPLLLTHHRLWTDITNSVRETLGPYGCGHTSLDKEAVWVSQNLWRDHLARYLGQAGPSFAQGYWDLQVMSNTAGQSLGFVDTYIGNNLCFHPRGIVAMGYLLCGPRLTIDQLAPGGPRFTLKPDRTYAQRWPLLPLADWKAGKIPICVVEVNADGSRVLIENEMDPVTVLTPNVEGGATIG